MYGTGYRWFNIPDLLLIPWIRIHKTPESGSETLARPTTADLCLVDAVYDGVLPQVGVQGHQGKRLLEAGLPSKLKII